VIVEVTITELDHQGRGIGTLDEGATATPVDGSAPIEGTSVSVPFTTPGDRVRASVWHRGREGMTADLLEILAPARDRTAPPCPLHGTCGGCQLQHLPYRRQLEWKASVVRHLAAPLGIADRVAPCVGSPREFGYRSKITPHHDYPRAGQTLAIGFLKVGRRHEVVDVERCALATDGINARLPQLRADVAAAAQVRSKGASFLVREATSGVTTDPDARVTERIAGLELEFFAREFFQNNPFLLPDLVKFVVDCAVSSGARVLVDSYSGSGLFALAAAARFQQVVGVEISPGAVEAARDNARRNSITNARFVAADAARIFAQVEADGSDAAVIIDPPRKGAGQAFLAQLVAFCPRAIVYVSCNPETMVRELDQLVIQAGYDVRVLKPFDMFPQTRHVECVAVLAHPGGGRSMVAR
jgi:tRNA/tmRNA/rRNA uracil-C5-methylase (TrmA/RlmC/RlmD family)